MHSPLQQHNALRRQRPRRAFVCLAILLIALYYAPAVNATAAGHDNTPPWAHDIANAAQRPLSPRPDDAAAAAAAEPAAVIPTPESGSGEAAQQNWLDTLSPLEELHHALETMQSQYFALWLGQWPSAIDWTAAVMATFVSASLHSLTRSLEYVLPGSTTTAEQQEEGRRQQQQQQQGGIEEGQRIENDISKYFSQSVAYYFGEDAFSIRMQAYDDMLWVVLGWLESIKFINLHADRHYRHSGPASGAWYGQQFVPGFAHRAHVFYNIAREGWDTELCGGGMTWNPRLTPYKNAITNQLFIAASVGMYLYFPGDANTSPFMAQQPTSSSMGDDGSDDDGGLPTARPHDRRYLRAAVAGYDWLRKSNMTNEQGLYVDGFHIRNWGKNGSIGTGRCDERNEMTYTYNQGVLLSGLRGLWEATGARWYLEDGHALVRNVIRATGWTTLRDEDDNSSSSSSKWHGIGRAGILEEACDAAASCSQNGQTFKGIFFHHLTLFCEPLPRAPAVPGVTHGASSAVAGLHRQSCKEYAAWVAHNARAALATRDKEGRFGMWWGAEGTQVEEEEGVLVEGAVDYRNEESLLEGDVWWKGEDEGGEELPSFLGFAGSLAEAIGGIGAARVDVNGGGASEEGEEGQSGAEMRDKNDRGRGRTVETQGGGVAVLRALWEFVDMYRD